MKVTRRTVLRGIGGAAVTLPFLETVAGRRVARGQDETPPFAIFFRQANGVAQATTTAEIGGEPERFWPRELGPLTPEGLAGRALDELVDYRDALLVVKNVNMALFDYGDGHARGCLQALTARPPVVPGAAGDSEANGESIDHRIGRELNPDGRDSLFLYAGQAGGFLGGPCISYRGPGNRRAPLHDPWAAYLSLFGGDGGMSGTAQRLLVERQQSVNDLVRERLDAFRSRADLSTADRRRLDLHLSSIRDIEVAVTCRLGEDEERRLEGLSPGYDSIDGDEVLETARLHMDLAAVAVACGLTRSVAIQVGSGNDGLTRYRDLETGERMENYHYVSHRRLSHNASGEIIEGSDVLHHQVDRQFARAFRHLLDRLDAHETPDGGTLLGKGLAVWYNDNRDGPPHGNWNVPWILAGSCGGVLRQGVTVALPGAWDEVNHNRLLNTIGTAVGVRNGDGPLDDFGDPRSPGGLLPELLV